MATYFFKDTTSYSISDPGNWYTDMYFGTPAGIVPDFSTNSGVIGDSSTPVRCDVDSNITVSNGNTLNVTANATLYIGNSSYVCVLVISNLSTLSLEPGSFCYITTNTEINNQSGGTILVNGQLTLQNGSQLANIGTTNIAGAVDIAIGASFIHNGALSTTIGGVLAVNPSTTFSIGVGSTIYNDGTFYNYGIINVPNNTTFTNQRTLINGPAAVFIINNTFSNGGTFNNQGSALNLNTFNNQGTFINLSAITNNGVFNTTAQGVFASSPNSNFNNNNQFIFGSVYNTYFKGKVFPQIPSSAAFGTAILF